MYIYIYIYIFFQSHRPLLSPTVFPALLFILHNKHSPSSTLRYTLINVSCTVYPQGDQCCADAPSLITLWVHPLRHLQHVLHHHFLLISLYLATRLCYSRPSPTSSHSLCPVSLSTSTQQYSCVNKLPLAFFIIPRRSRFTSHHLPLLVSILALCGDIHANPGPSARFSSLCTYNIRSLISNDHISALNDFIETHHPNIIALTETWINKSSTPSELANATTSGYTLLSYPHTTTNHISDKTLGGETAFLILDAISIILNPSYNYKSFESSSVKLNLPSSTITVFNIYRPPSSSKYSQPISVFLDEFQTFLSSAATTPHEFILTGNFNIHPVDQLDSSSQQFRDLLSSNNLTEYVSVSTHIHNYTLVLVITSSQTNLSPTISQSFITVSDHFHIFTHLNITPTPPASPCEFPFRRTKNINVIEFNNDLASSDQILHPPTLLPELLNSYDSTLRSIFDKHAPLITKFSKPRKPNSWYTPALRALKSARPHRERKYISTHSVQDYKILRTATNQYHKLIAHA